MKEELLALIRELFPTTDGIVTSSNRMGRYVLNGFAAEEDEGGVTLRYTGERKHEFDEFTVRADVQDDFVLFSCRITLHYWNGEICDFLPREAVSFPMRDVPTDGILASFREKPWWTYPCFPAALSRLPDRTQSLFLKKGGRHYHFLPLTGDNFRCEFFPGRLSLSSDTAGLRTLSGPFLALAAGSDPYEAVSRSYEKARKAGAIRVPLKKERTLPAMFGDFGYCTWNSFYTDVSAEKIYRKLDEFREKGIPVRWMIIDDGWMQTRDSRLCSFDADPVKFPEGLKETVRRINSYGVRVGVWHAFFGYWEGIHPASPLFEAQKGNLDHTPGDRWIPSLDEKKAFRFWDAWHSYLASCGVEFLKVDNQSSSSGAFAGMMPTAVACRRAHNAFERSVMKNFGGRLINCMGMEMENVLARPFTALTRNSDDFFPNNERSFSVHLFQNAYNALWEDQLYYCDYDMWWSDHPSSVASGVLRAISGSPVYVSDEIGRSRLENILPVCEPDGNVCRLDGAAIPTGDCVYHDCKEEGRLFKVFNTKGNAFAVAAFNPCGKEIADAIDFREIPAAADGDFIAYEFFTGKYYRVSRNTVLPVTLPADGTAVFSVYPILMKEGEQVIRIGNTQKYVSIGSSVKMTVPVSSLPL